MKYLTEWKNILLNNKKVVENYFFMTVLQILNSFFYLLIYPYLIRTLGANSYGIYVFALSVITYFITFISFGFDMPGVKAIAENADNKAAKEQTLSAVFTAKIYLEFAALLVFSVLVFSIPFFRKNYILYFILFSQTLANVLFPQWYFQGIQRMRTVTFIQLGFKILTLPFIFLLIKTSSDFTTFAAISTSGILAGAITAFLLIRYIDGLKIVWQPINALKNSYKDAFPFFASGAVGVLKEQSIIQIIGIFLNFTDVAIYDFANKIILLPRTIFSSLNGAIFPKIIQNYVGENVRKIIKTEYFIGLAVIVGVALLGGVAVKILGGAPMAASYPTAIILSVTVLTWLVVGAYINFIFIPNKKYYYVTKNQILALVSFVVYAVIGLLYMQNVYVMAAALSLSGLTEIVYTQFITSKNRLLK